MARRRKPARRKAPAAPPDRGLDALNLLTATMGTAYGTFIPVYLTAQAWTQTRIGLVLTIATVVSALCQIPAGMMVDAAGPRRRRLLWVTVTIIGLTPLVLAALPLPLPVMAVMALQSAAGTLLSPAIAAVSLAVAGQDGLGTRLGRNAAFGSAGAGLGAAVMGAASTFLSHQAVFLISAALMPLALFAITRIGHDHAETHAAEHAHGPDETPGLLAPLALLRDRRVLVFAACLMLFQLSSIAVLQLAAVEVTARGGARSGLAIAAFLIVPQAVVALVATWVGGMAQHHGRRIVLLLGFATVPLRAAGFAVIHSPYVLVGVQVLEGLGGAVLGVLMPLVAADLTRRRRYTLCLALLSLAATLGAALSTTIAGPIADRFGRPAAFWALAGFGVAAVLLVAAAMPETKRGHGAGGGRGGRPGKAHAAGQRERVGHDAALGRPGI
jgi:MFS family permease